MSGGIAIFVKTPGHSAVKTRLAVAVGDEAACDWYVRAAATVAAVATAAAAAVGATVYFAVAEPAAVAAGAWADLPSLGQGEGGTGARMARVHHELVRRHGYGVLLGADAPQLAVGALGDALAWCAASEPRQALGAASDGGFWLYGGNRAAPRAAWEAIVYSRPDTAECFRVVFAAHGAFLSLAPLTDVDHGGDLPALTRELAALAAPLPAQRAFADWLAATFGADGAGRRAAR